MAIIYSYPKASSIIGSDLFICTKLDDSTNVAKQVSVSADVLAAYIGNNLSSDVTLNDVLTNGNESLLDAKIGDLYFWDNTNDAYAKITGDKNRVNFYGIDNRYYGYIGAGTIRLVNLTNSLGLNIQKPTTVTAERFVTFQDASGTVAYLSDILETANYGLATQLADSTAISNTTTPTSLLSATYAGTLTVPADTFQVGDSFNAYLMGHISCPNAINLTITIETVAGVTLATTGAMSLNAATAKHWQLNTTFVVRAIGGTGTARLITTGSFSYNKNSNNNAEAFDFVSANDTTFDTTVTNELVIKATWGTASASASIYSNVFTLTKVY